MSLNLNYWYNCLKFIMPIGWFPLNNGEKINPFFIIGSGRSGNTLLRRILFNHSELHIPPETYVLGQIIRVYSVNRNLSWKEIVYLIFAYLEFHEEFETFQISLRPLVGELIGLPAEKRSLSYILDRFYRYHAAHHGIICRRWGDKTPLNTFYLKKIISVFPDAQFIHILRDGCDVAESYCRSGIYKDITSAGKRWVNAVTAAQEFMYSYPEKCIEIRYEELVSRPEQTTKWLCDFLNVAYEPGMLEPNVQAMGDVEMRRHHINTSCEISTGKIGVGRKILTIDQKEELQPIIGSLLKSLGYERCAL